MTRRNQPIGTREEVELAIFENRVIADLSYLRERLCELVGRPVDWFMRNRSEHLAPFASFLQQVLSPDSSNPRIRALVAQLASNLMAQQCGGVPAVPLRPAPDDLDPRWNDASDPLPLIFEIVFQDESLLDQWMRLLDAHVESTTHAIIAEIDKEPKTQARPVRKDVVLIGGGPLTSVVASLLGAFFRVTVVAQQRGLGRPWRNRKGIWINSSCAIRNFHALALPLLGGGTTRVVASQQWNSVDVNVLLNRDTLRVPCDNGSVVDYAVGSLLGDLVATDILFHADDYLVCQQVDLSALERNADNSIGLRLVDMERGTERLIDANAVFVLTGPAPEQTRLADPSSRALYRSSADLVDSLLESAREELRRELEKQRGLEVTFTGEDAKRFRRNRLRMEATRIARMVKRGIPRLLTLTAVEKLYDLWQQLEELGAEPDDFPLADIVNNGKSIAYIGDGDTSRSLKQWMENGPLGAVPRGFIPSGLPPRGTIYNEEAQSPAEYARINRRRYRDVFTPTTRAIPYKATRYRITYRSGKECVEVTHRDAFGQRRRLYYDYVFDATGLDQGRIEDSLPPQFTMDTFYDLQGRPVGRKDRVSDLFILGAAAGFRVQDFPLEIQRIIQALGSGDNLLALWANGLLAELAAYTYAITRGMTKAAPDVQ
jgi:hypothetical protein